MNFEEELIQLKFIGNLFGFFTKLKNEVFILFLITY